MKRWADSLSKYIQSFRLAVFEQTSFRFSFLLSFGTMPIVFVVYYYLWSLAFTWKGNLDDYAFPVLMTSLLGSTVIRTMLASNGTGEAIESHIQRGDILVHLVRPIQYFWYQFAFQFGRNLPKIVLGFIILGAIHLHFIHSLPSWTQAGMACILIALGFFAFFQLYFLSGIAAFWFGETWGIRNLYNHLTWLLGGATVPTSLFPEAIQQVAFALPFHHAMYVPSEILLGRMDAVQFTESIVILTAWILLLHVFQSLAWERGLRKHDGKG